MTYLQALHLHNYRQFADVAITPHPRLNVIVGNNGEGKSNLLESIQQIIVASPAEERAKLIRTGAESAEIQLDLPSFVLNKAIRPKFEEFRLNGREISHKQLKCHLESVGLTQFNYLEQNEQNLYGQLQDLYEIQDFEQRQKQNRSSLQSAEKLQEEAKGLIEDLKTYSKDLEKETADLASYQRIFEQKQAADRAMTQFDLQTETEAASAVESQIASAQEKLHKLQANKQQISAEDTAQSARIAELEQALAQNSTAFKLKKQQKLDLDELIAQSPEFYISVQSQTQALSGVAEEIQYLNTQKQALIYLKTTLAARLQALAGADAADAARSERELKVRFQSAKSALAELEAYLDVQNRQLAALQQPAGLQQSKTRLEYQTLQQKQQTCQLQQAKLAKAHQAAFYDLQKSLTELHRTLPQAVSAPLQYVEAVVKQRQARYHDRYFGPLYQNISFDDAIAGLMDAAAGMQLFSLVVDTEATALELIDALNAESYVDPALRGTRIAFLPLENYSEAQRTVLDLPANAMQVSQLLETQPRFYGLVNRLFDRQVVCQTLAAASELAETAKLECYTLDGDAALGNGVLTGGYRNAARTRCCCEVQRLLAYATGLDYKIYDNYADLRQISAQLQQMQAQVIAEQREERVAAEQLAQFRMAYLYLSEAVDATQAALSAYQHEVSQLAAQLASVYRGAAPDGQENAFFGQQDVYGLDEQQKARFAVNAAVTPAEIKARVSDIELEVFKIDYKQDLLYQKLRADQQKHTTLQISLDVQLAKLKRALVDIELPETVGMSEALETAQRVANELQAQITALAEAVFVQQRTLQEAYQAQSDLQQAAAETQAALSASESQIALLTESAQMHQMKCQNLNIRLLTLTPLAAPAETPYFASRMEALRIAGQATRNLRYFENLNKLALEQYYLLRQRLESSQAKLDRFAAERQQLSSTVDYCDSQFKTQFSTTYEQVQASYQRFLQFLSGLSGHLEIRQVEGGEAVENAGAKQAEDADAEDGNNAKRPGRRAYYSPKAVKATPKAAKQRAHEASTIDLCVDVPGVPSSGQKAAARVAYALALQQKQQIVLLDESDAFLDQAAKQRFGALLKQISAERQIFCVTFNRNLCGLADAVFHIENGRVQAISDSEVQALTFLQ